MFGFCTVYFLLLNCCHLSMYFSLFSSISCFYSFYIAKQFYIYFQHFGELTWAETHENSDIPVEMAIKLYSINFYSILKPSEITAFTATTLNLHICSIHGCFSCRCQPSKYQHSILSKYQVNSNFCHPPHLKGKTHAVRNVNEKTA